VDLLYAGSCGAGGSAAFVGVDDAPLGAELADGRRLARCLRCDSWIEHLAPVAEEIKYDTIPPLDQLKKPRRGKPLHEAIGMRLIAINKGTHAFGFTLVAIGLTLTRTNLFQLKNWAHRLLDFAQAPLNNAGQQHGQTWLGRQLEHNLVLLIWLIYNKRLFGARGGHAAMLAHDDVDWDTVLHTPTPAKGKLIRDEIEEVVVSATTSRA
jgi:hypothetical protein